MRKHTLFLIFIIAFAFALVLDSAQNGNILDFAETTVIAPPEDNVLSVQNPQYTGGKININTASVPVLDSLDGIGREYAERIIKYRSKIGGFEVIHDIMKVPGIGEKRFLKIKDSITVK